MHHCPSVHISMVMKALMVANIVGSVTKSGLSLDIHACHEINATSTNAKGHIPLQLQHIRLIMALVVT